MAARDRTDGEKTRGYREKERSRDPEHGTQVAELVDAVQRENGLIGQFLLPDPDPA